MKQVTLISAAIAIALLASHSAAEEKLQKLTGSQIRAKLAGFEFTDEIHFRDFYERSSRLTSKHLGKLSRAELRVLWEREFGERGQPVSSLPIARREMRANSRQTDLTNKPL